MLKMGIPLGAVKQALQKEGKDPSIIDLDPEKSYSSQMKDANADAAELPIKDDPEYAKFFKVCLLSQIIIYDVKNCSLTVCGYNYHHKYLDA
jgi:hypothetical protein